MINRIPTAVLMKLLTPSPYRWRMCISNFTPAMEPGTLPRARASTTFRRTVPFFRCIRLAGIFVKKLKSASEPTATMGGTLSPKISTGSSSTPPPTPLIPMRMPTINPITIFSRSSSMKKQSAVYAAAPFTPMKPSRSRCRIISCAASSGDNSPVLIVTSASLGASYGSEIPVNSLRIPARALA